jgi:hypothetical protein
MGELFTRLIQLDQRASNIGTRFHVEGGQIYLVHGFGHSAGIGLDLQRLTGEPLRRIAGVRTFVDCFWRQGGTLHLFGNDRHLAVDLERRRVASRERLTRPRSSYALAAAGSVAALSGGSRGERGLTVWFRAADDGQIAPFAELATEARSSPVARDERRWWLWDARTAVEVELSDGQARAVRTLSFAQPLAALLFDFARGRAIALAARSGTEHDLACLDLERGTVERGAATTLGMLVPDDDGVTVVEMGRLHSFSADGRTALGTTEVPELKPAIFPLRAQTLGPSEILVLVEAAGGLALLHLAWGAAAARARARGQASAG